MFFNLNNKAYLLFLILIITLIKGYSQDLHYSNNYENGFNLNPANITNIQKSAFYLNYRNQWPGSSDFINYSGAFFSTFKDYNSTIGLEIIRDSEGKDIINNTGFTFLYGYVAKIAANALFSTGLSGSYNVYKVNSSLLIFENNNAPAFIENIKSKYFDFSAGLEFSLFDNHFGASVSHITSPTIYAENKISRKYTFIYRGNYSLLNHYSPKKIILEPLLLTSIQSNNNEIVYGSRINYNGIIGGIYVRNDYRFKFDSFIILLGISLANITVNYSYDINLSGAQSRFNKLASHEVTFFYNLEYNIRRNKKGAIKCPKF
jgi:type IX secretion system PorP/SprF family membrane protein